MTFRRLRNLTANVAASALAACLLPAALHAQSVGASSQIPSRISGPISESSLVTLKGNVSPLATTANDRGAAPASLQLSQMHLVLKRTAAQQTALTQLIQAQHDPSSPQYHKWLTPAEFGAKFGPSQQDVQRIESWLSSQGFSNVKADPGNLTIRFDGSVSQLQNTFHTTYHQYAINGQMHYAAATEPMIPSALAPVVKGFVSLNDFPVRSYSRKLGLATYNPETHKATPQWTYPEGNGESFVLSPQDFGVEYDLPNPALNSSYSGTTYDGTGQTIAIINDSNINVSLVNSFRSLFNLPANPPQVIIDGNDPGIDGVNNPDGSNGDSSEAYLDVEWAGAVAPKATVDLVIAADTASESGLILAAEHAVYSDLAPVMSVSFGNCEASLGASSNEFLSNLWEQAAAEGITVIVSSGDSGSAGCDNPNTETYATKGTGVNGFASTPYNVAVGGTDFYYSSWNQGTNAIDTQLGTYWSGQTSTTPTESLKQYIPEQAWNDSQFGDDILNYYNLTGSSTIVGGGGGASSDAYCSGTISSSTGSCSVNLTGYPKPAWQSGTGVPSDKVRDVPDVSLFAADGINASYYPICASDGDCQSASGSNPVQITGIGGTSAAAPAFAGIMALVNQATNNRQGQADMVLYPLAAQYPAAFHDVVNGSNSVPCQYSATSTSNSPNCIAASNAITVNNVTEGQLGTGTTPAYNAGTGYDQASGLGSVDAAKLIADWSNVKFASTTVTLTPSSTSFTHGSAITIQGSVTGGSTTPTGTVALVTSSSEPVQGGVTNFTLSNGSYSASINFLPGGTYQIWGQYSGDSANAANTSSKTSITVNPESSTLELSIPNVGSSSTGTQAISSGGSVPYGTQLLLDGRPEPSSCASNGCSSTGYGVPTGTVAFADNGATLNTATINSEGVAEYNAPFAVGSHSVTATYSGDNSYNTSSASAINFTITKDTPSVSLTGSGYLGASTAGADQYLQGQANSLNVLVENSANAALESSFNNQLLAAVPVAAPTGNVTITVTGPQAYTFTQALSAGTDRSTASVYGVASFTLPSSAPAGTYSVQVTYPGDGNYAPVTQTSSLVLETASAAGLNTGSMASTTSATATGGDNNGGTSSTAAITVSISVTGISGSAAPTGTVVLDASGQQVGSATLAAPSSGVTSTATVTLSSASLLQGSNQIQVQYVGDSNYQPSSNTLILNNSLSDFSMVPSTSFVGISAGGNATVPITLSSVNGFNGAINITCNAGTGITCALDHSSYTIAAGGTATAQLTLTASSSASNATNPFNGWLGGGAALACAFLLAIPARKRSWRGMLGVLLLIVVLGFGIGCGSSSSSSGSGGGSTSNNNFGASCPNCINVSVTATSGNTTHTLSIAADVQ